MSAVQLAILGVGGAVGIESLSVARRSPGFSFAATSGWAASLELASGWALILAGVIALRSPTRRRVGVILSCAGLAWFVPEWNNPGVGSALLFTTGLVFFTVCPAVVAHAVLRYPDRRLDTLETVAVGAAYLSTLVLGGLLLAIAFAPAQTGCSECPTNLVNLTDAATLAERASRASIYAGVLWTAALIVIVGLRMIRSSPTRRWIAGPVLLPAMAYLAAVGLDYAHSVGRAFFDDDSTARRLWMVQGVALILIAFGTGWAFVRTRIIRTAIARLVVETAGIQAGDGLATALGDALGDATLQVMYPLSDGRFTDRTGHPVKPGRDQATTSLTRDSTMVALLAHRPGLLDATAAADDIAATARLALESERLQAEQHAQLVDLQASRSRFIAASDTERRRLERDLHDGAQQRLVALALDLRLARLRLANGVTPAVAARLEEAQTEVTAALKELREVARGLYPRELADEGLAAGLETLAESAPIPVRLHETIEDRFPQPIESAAYFAVDYCIRQPRGGSASVSVGRCDGLLRLEIETAATPADLVPLEDRVGALAGRVVSEPSNSGGTRITVELPCE